MDRRRFLIDGGRVMLILPAGWALVSCVNSGVDSDNNPPVTTPPATNVLTGALTFTSSVAVEHVHLFTVNMAEISSPPPAGIGPRTTSPAPVNGHVHVVTLTEIQLEEIGSNGTATVNTSVVEDHFHTYTFNLAGAQVPIVGMPTTPTTTGG
jgi:hypothetical protein